MFTELIGKCLSDGCNEAIKRKYKSETGKVQYRQRCFSCHHNWINYKITTPEREIMLEQQDNCCAICETKVLFGVGTRQLNGAVIDHCHSNGHVRGILCNGCNIALGLFKDNKLTLIKAIQYLQET
jgi:hypothetical protein